MSVSKKHLRDATLREKVVRQYRSLEMTKQQISELYGITYPTVMAILRDALSDDELSTLRGAYHSRSKTGKANPMFGRKSASERILRQGRAAVWNGKDYTFEHRLIAAKSLEIPALPPHLRVHHIDGDKTNNDPDNLAIVTPKGHGYLHKMLFGRLYLWEKVKFGTSLLPEMQATLLKD